ncbi:hypothetical protein FN846DRAFT_980481 [Sphaerosporella brunnea]|uniref:Uncharacterized protein n=1 Tax=Sphaerosporella brunnea TaxID=1250544 RepID=A0A5J5ECX2_9PEZI|nr:hypothetical protein FN846DRAFT_980481 [Sphaerosporella brunnea]
MLDPIGTECSLSPPFPAQPSGPGNSEGPTPVAPSASFPESSAAIPSALEPTTQAQPRSPGNSEISTPATPSSSPRASVVVRSPSLPTNSILPEPGPKLPPAENMIMSARSPSRMTPTSSLRTDMLTTATQQRNEAIFPSAKVQVQDEATGGIISADEEHDDSPDSGTTNCDEENAKRQTEEERHRSFSPLEPTTPAQPGETGNSESPIPSASLSESSAAVPSPTPFEPGPGPKLPPLEDMLRSAYPPIRATSTFSLRTGTFAPPAQLSDGTAIPGTMQGQDGTAGDIFSEDEEHDDCSDGETSDYTEEDLIALNLSKEAADYAAMPPPPLPRRPITRAPPETQNLHNQGNQYAEKWLSMVNEQLGYWVWFSVVDTLKDWKNSEIDTSVMVGMIRAKLRAAPNLLEGFEQVYQGSMFCGETEKVEAVMPRKGK